jgi:hypothetical protein
MLSMSLRKPFTIAVAQALHVFREHEWCDPDLRGNAASVVVKITPPKSSIGSVSGILQAGSNRSEKARRR